MMEHRTVLEVHLLINVGNSICAVGRIHCLLQHTSFFGSMKTRIIKNIILIHKKSLTKNEFFASKFFTIQKYDFSQFSVFELNMYTNVYKYPGIFFVCDVIKD